jgi:hypothetical protein
MKKNIIIGSVVVALGLLISLGPQFLFKVCAVHEDGGFPHCHWSAQAEIGMGILIVALGICMVVFKDAKTLLGLSIGVFLSGIVSLGIIHFLVGGCGSAAMACRRVAFPALTVESIILLVFTAVVVVYIEMKKLSA